MHAYTCLDQTKIAQITYMPMFTILKADDISGFHSNTHIPIVIGAQMRYEITGDELYKVSQWLHYS